MTTETIDESSFAHWRRHPITERVFERLQELDGGLKNVLLNASVILADDGQIQYSRIVGNREIIDHILTITFEDLETRKEKEENEES